MVACGRSCRREIEQRTMCRCIDVRRWNQRSSVVRADLTFVVVVMNCPGQASRTESKSWTNRGRQRFSSTCRPDDRSLRIPSPRVNEPTTLITRRSSRWLDARNISRPRSPTKFVRPIRFPSVRDWNSLSLHDFNISLIFFPSFNNR